MEQTVKPNTNESSYENLNTTNWDTIEENEVFHLLSRNQKQDFASWILRQYINKPNSRWFNLNIEPQNVFKFLSDPKFGFPHTPNSIVSLYKLKCQLQKSLGKHTELETDEADKTELKDGEDKRFFFGDVSLKNISKEVGGITNSMISRISYQAMEKIKNLTGGVNIENLSYEEDIKLENRLNRALDRAANIYAGIIYSSSSYDEILSKLRKYNIIKSHDVSQISSIEKKWLEYYVNVTCIDQIVEDLKYDLLYEDDNIVKTFQLLYGKLVHRDTNIKL